MTAEAQHVLDDLLRLPSRERAHVLAEALARLDGEPDADAEEAWRREVLSRADRIVRGETVGRDWEEVSRDLEAKYSRK